MRDLIQRRHLDRLWRLVGSTAAAAQPQPCAAMVVRVPAGGACSVALPEGRWELVALGGPLWITPGDGSELLLEADERAIVTRRAHALVLASLGAEAAAILRAAPDP